MKSLNRNTRPKGQPDQTYRYGKNGLSNATLGTVENEAGFVLEPAVLPYKFNGAIATDKYPVVFSTNNVHSAIGYYNTDTHAYVPILNDATMSFKLGFHSDWYITGEAQRNHLGEIVVAYTNKNKVTGYLNCDNPNIAQLADLSLFPIVEAPAIVIGQETGGSLFPGAYFAMSRYAKKDGTMTGFVGNSGVTIVANSTGNQLTDRVITMQFTELDTKYDFLEVAIVSKVAGAYTTPQLLPEIPITASTMRVVYTGTEVTTDLALENILIPPAYYENVQTIGQLNGSLYIGGLDSSPVINMQKWVNMVNVKWASELVNVTTPEPALVRGEKRGFMHEEVYALYLQFSKRSGGWTQWFHVPGNTPAPINLAPSTTGLAEGITAKRFQIEDTIPSFDLASKRGETGVWQNENEVYPDNPDFDSSPFGGRNLRGQKVLHHRMPSITWCKTNLYASEVKYGKDSLDLLGLYLSNIVIPAEYSKLLDGGWRLGFARRDLSNSTVVGQSALLHGARFGHYTGTTVTIDVADNNYVSTGGNFHSARQRTGHVPDKAVGVDRKVMRMHPFDLLFSKPTVAPQYLSTHLKLRRNNLISEQEILEDFDLGNDTKIGPIVYRIDYLAKGITPTVVNILQRYRKLIDPTYVPNNLSVNKWNNVDLETAYGANLSSPVLDDADVPRQNVREQDSRQDINYCANWEVTFLSNMMNLRDDVYSPFTRQTMIQASSKILGTAGFVTSGDTFVSEYVFHTYGWWDQLNTKFSTIAGTKVVRRIVCETAANLYARYEDPGNLYSRFYPKSPLVRDDANNYITQFVVQKDPNQFGYDKDLNALNELTLSVGIHTVNDPTDTKHPFRIHRGGQIGRQDKTRSWRTFLPLDYYEIKKNVGPIVNLKGQDDRLLIHCTKALLVTQDKTKLESDVLKVTLGAGDIFQFDPQDAQASPLGHAGTFHDLAAMLTPVGYFSVDTGNGMVYLYKGNQVDSISKGLYLDFLKILKVLPTNVLQGDGITVGYDPEKQRLLLTVKNGQPDRPYRIWTGDADINLLSPGDLVLMDNRFLEYVGVNDPLVSAVTCATHHIPLVENSEYFYASGSYANVEITVLGGIFVATVELLGVAPSTSVFYIDPSTNKLYINGVVNGFAVPVWTLTCRATSDTGDTTDFTVVINIAP